MNAVVTPDEDTSVFRVNLASYIGIKRVRATPMNRADYNTLRDWQLPADENGADEGYLVEYVDGGAPNLPHLFEGYVSWSPKDVFERAYRAETGIGSFSNALEALKSGYRVARVGWNGKGMWLTVSPGATVPYEALWAHHNRDFAAAQPGGQATVRPFITMKTADDEIVPWVASQTDILADDWVVLT